MADSSATTTTPNVPFFKKRAQSKNVRKRNLSDDDDTTPQNTFSTESSNLNHTSLSSVSKKRNAKRGPQTSHADILQSSSTSSANRLASKDEDTDKTVGIAYKATLEGNIRIDDATRTQEIDTAHDRDAQAVIDRHMRAVENGLDDSAQDDGLYKGMAGYKSHIQKGEVSNSKIRYVSRN
jgi:RING finger protein 113A